jgi:hypothetical protein
MRNTLNGAERRSSAPSKRARQSVEERRKAADRMRLSRRRKQLRLRCYSVELHDDEVAALIRQGYLQGERRGDRAAVLSALYAFLDQRLV